MEIICFFIGLLYIYTSKFYSFAFIVVIFVIRPNFIYLVCFIIGIAWALGHEWVNQDINMPTERKISKVVIQGELMQINQNKWQLALTKFQQKPAKATVILSCYKDCPKVNAGEVWQFTVNLHKPKNLANPGSFDYESWLKARHISFAGTIQPKTGVLLKKTSGNNLLTLRQKLADFLATGITKPEVLGILQALILGLSSKITVQQWELFRHTGTVHLLVISGAHIGLVASLGYKLIKWLWLRHHKWMLYYPALKVGSIGGILLAMMYSVLAGFGVPVQRSMVACTLFLMRNFLNYKFTSWQSWRYGLLLVLMIEPHAVLLPGFYLSFIAVVILILINYRFKWSKIKKLIYVQLACLIGLAPFTLYWFSYLAINGLIANLVAIPLIGFIIVPLALISLVIFLLCPLKIILYPVQETISFLLKYLSWVDQFSFVNVNFALPDFFAVITLSLAIIILILLPFKIFYFPALILLIFSFYPLNSRLSQGEVQVDVMDVGQGLAVVINTARHTLIYDAGIKFYNSENDMAKLAIIPYLNILGIKKLNKIIISHPDIDHRGGLVSLDKFYPDTELLVDDVAFYRRGKSCHEYPPWSLDGVKFKFFPINPKLRGKNNNSCILQIINNVGVMLLPGDLEKRGESYLLKKYANELKATVLLIPHHGSKTSSSPEFIKKVAPEAAIISAGLDNRYHFPHEQTIKTLIKNNINIYNTMDCGMVTIKFLKHKIIKKCYKVQ